MEVNKAENVMLHHDEIAARPAKTWFQSEAEKKKIKGTRVEYAMRGGGKELTNVYIALSILVVRHCVRVQLFPSKQRSRRVQRNQRTTMMKPHRMTRNQEDRLDAGARSGSR